MRDAPAKMTTASWQLNTSPWPYGPSTAPVTLILHSSSAPRPRARFARSTFSFIRLVKPSLTLMIKASSPLSPGTVAAVKGCSSHGMRDMPGTSM